MSQKFCLQGKLSYVKIYYSICVVFYVSLSQLHYITFSYSEIKILSELDCWVIL